MAETETSSNQPPNLEAQREEVKDIRLFLDSGYCPFHWNETRWAEDLYVWEVTLNGEISFKVDVNFEENTFTFSLSNGEKEKFVNKVAVPPHRDKYKVLFKGFKTYVNRFTENQRAIEINFDQRPKILRKIEGIPGWEDKSILQDLHNRITEDLEKEEPFNPNECLTEGQIEMIDEIRRERRLEQDEEEANRRSEILTEMIEEYEGNPEDKSWEVEKLGEIQDKVESSKFLQNSEKSIIAEKMDDLGRTEEWGPYVDRLREEV